MKKSIGIFSSVIMATSLLAGPVVQAEGNLPNDGEGYTYIDEVELNDTFSSANQTLSNETAVHGTFSESDVDYYKVEVGGAGYQQLLLALYPDGVNITDMKMHVNVYNSDQEEVHPHSAFNMFAGSYFVKPGTYYVEAQDLNNINNGKKYELITHVTEELEDVVRWTAGKDRYETAAKIAEESRAYGYAENIVLASGEDFPDALAGSPLAYHLDAELLLTQKDKLPEATEKMLKTFKTKNVTIIGGTGAISNEVENYLKNELNIKVDRISGKDRYATAAAVAAELPDSEKAVVAYGSDYPDALSIAPYAAKNSMPILLTGKNETPEATEEALKNYDKSIAVGGTGVISENVFNNLPDAERISGKDRYSTSVAVAEYFDWTIPTVNFATGEGYADALAGSIQSAKLGAPMVLTPKDKLAPSTKQYLKENEANYYRLFGGEGAISKSVVDELIEIQQGK